MLPLPLPNVHALLRRIQRQAGVAPYVVVLELWLDGARFRVRDLAGRHAADIVGDVTAPRGFGVPARELEEMMDRDFLARSARRGPPTELFGDLATGAGWVYPAVGARYPLPAHDLAPAAAQILAHGKADGLAAVGPDERLGRAATVYRGVVAVTEDGARFENAVVRTLAPPYLLLEDAHDVRVATLGLSRELLALDEGVVTDADLAPP